MLYRLIPSRGAEPKSLGAGLNPPHWARVAGLPGRLASSQFARPDDQRRLHWIGASMKSALPIAIWFMLVLCSSAFAQLAPAAPAEMISNYRLQHGEGRVTPDSTLNRIAHEQAAAMAAKDLLDHNTALAPFASRVAAAKSQRSAENIAYGYDTFPKTLDQWIDSPEHRKNLLMPGALKVGVASAKSPTTHRTYWAMVITSGERSQSASSAAHRTTSRRDDEACRMKIWNGRRPPRRGDLSNENSGSVLVSR